MVDILHYAKPRRFIGSGARNNNYNICFDPGVRKARRKEEHTRRTRPPSTYTYVVKVVHDPLDIGAFNADTVFTVGEFNCMLIYGAFTIGTSLIVRNKLCFVHSGDNGGQCVKYFKPASA